MLTTEERLENAIKNQPERYIAVRDSNNALLQVHDSDSGYSYYSFTKDGEKHWMWCD